MAERVRRSPLLLLAMIAGTAAAREEPLRGRAPGATLRRSAGRRAKLDLRMPLRGAVTIESHLRA